MYPIDATKEAFEVVEIIGIPGLFTIQRVNRSTVPKGMYLYEMQTSEEDRSQPCLLGHRIIVEHFGTILTASPIELSRNGYLDLFPGDFCQRGPQKSMTVMEFEDECFGRRTQTQQHIHRHKPRKVHAALAR